ncbi:MAG: hypothetical protein ACRES8_00340 [Nevskiaceae bacterium]
MTCIRLLAASLSLAAAGLAHAGSSGAGPAASAGPAVGSVVTPGSHALLNTLVKDDNNDRILPGNGGVVVLQGEQLARTAEALRGFAEATVQNEVIKAPTVLADGTPAVIALNTRTGRLSVTRQEY